MIEFDDDAAVAESDDEELEQRPESRWARTPLARRRLLVVAAVLAVGAVFGVALVQGRGARQAADSAGPSTSTSVAPPSGTSADGGLLVEHLGDRNGTLRNDVEVTLPGRLVAPPCPRSSDGFAACVVRAGVPSDFAAAMRRYYPQATHAMASTTVLRSSEPFSKPGLWTRSYRASVGRATLAILVTRKAADDTTIPVTLQSGRTAVTYLRHDNGRNRVEIVVRSPRAKPFPVSNLAALAADARLVSG